MANFTNRWVVLALLFFARASMAMQFQSIPPISTLLVEELGFNFTQIGLLIGLWMLPGFFIALPGGLLGQRFGDKTVVIAGLSLQVVGALVLSNANGFQVAAAGRLLGGVGAVALNVQLTKIVNDWFADKEISTSMGILMTAWPFGIALALFTAGMLVSLTSWITIGSIPLGGWLTDRTGRVNAFIVGGVLLNALFIFLVPLDSSVLICLLLLGITMGGWPGAIMALPNQVLSFQSRSTGFGVFYMVYYGIVAALVPVAGWLRDFTGEATASVLFGGLMMILTVAALIAFRVIKRRWPAKEPGQLMESTT